MYNVHRGGSTYGWYSVLYVALYTMCDVDCVYAILILQEVHIMWYDKRSPPHFPRKFGIGLYKPNNHHRYLCVTNEVFYESSVTVQIIGLELQTI